MAGSTGKAKGAQPGNLNALKHGVYSKRLKDLTPEELEQMAENGDLKQEIGMVRVVMRRVFDLVDDAATGESGLEGWASSLNALGTAATRLAGLLRTQQALTGGSSEIAEALSQALREVSNAQ
jgi:hypothetical protein